MRLVYISPVPWDSFAQRPHKFVEWFHNRTDAPVLWVDPYPTRFPNWRDFFRLRPSVLSKRCGVTPPWLTVLKPCGLPIEPMPGSGWINGLLWQRHLNQINDFARSTKTLCAIGKPSIFALNVLKRLRYCPSLYDAMDDFPAFYTGISHYALEYRERKVAQEVDVIWTSSSELKSRWEAVHGDVSLVHNGLDLSAIDAVVLEPKSIEKKVFGYVGTIASWFDWEWVCALAESRPSDEIHLIGPIFEKPAGRLPSNINLFPACDHAMALKAMQQFHVGLIPFKKNALTASVDPIKYYEYRALNLPVVSTDFGEMSLRADECGVFVSQSLSDVPTLIEMAIQFEGDANRGSGMSVRNDWGARFDSANFFL